MLKDMLKKSRSYRAYDEARKITREELLDIVDCARYAPSSVNQQPLKYYLAYKQEQLDTIQPLTGWAKALPDKDLPYPGKRPTAFIVICQEKQWSANTSAYLRDIGCVAQTMILSAVEKGLGGIMIGNFNPENLRIALGLPEHIIPMLVVALGKPDETVVITEVSEDESIRYYRDENDVHYVPKRKLEDIVI